MRTINEIENDLQPIFKKVDDIAYKNQVRILNAFKNCNITSSHFAGTTGYGYSDLGREKLCQLFAEVFQTEDAIVSPLLTCATHALTVALFGILKSNDTMFAITGKPYETLDDIIQKEGIGGFKDYLIGYEEADIYKQDFAEIEKRLLFVKPKLVFIQRSRGYNWIQGLSKDDIVKLTKRIRQLLPETYIFLDNCYGEFTYEEEPTKYLDVCVGSLIKNAGGGIAGTGAYIVGSKRAIEQIAGRFTSPSIGNEVGSFEFGYRNYFEGLFLAPQVVKNASKGGTLIAQVLKDKGFEVLPDVDGEINDIVKSIRFNDKEKLIKFVQLVQKYAPVDSNFVPEPYDMAGYNEQVIMASGSFVGGSSIELSCDAPIKEPYIGYFQGGLTYEHCKYVAEMVLQEL